MNARKPTRGAPKAASRIMKTVAVSVGSDKRSKKKEQKEKHKIGKHTLLEAQKQHTKQKDNRTGSA